MKMCILVDEAMTADGNAAQKEAENKFKYKSSCIEVQGMWNLKRKIIPVITGTIGIVTKSLKKNFKYI